MEAVKRYQVEVTLRAKLHYFEILDYFFEQMSPMSAAKKADELYEVVSSLETLPERGQIEFALRRLQKDHRYLLYKSTSRRTIKVIYFLDKERDVVYVTDFFPTEMNEEKIADRNS